MARTSGSHSKTTWPRIQDAALALFARYGYAAVSMRQIASDVGVQVGALYNYTPDKQSLLFGLMKGHMDALLEGWHSQEQPSDPLHALEAFAKFHVRFHRARPDAVFIAYMELRNLSGENFEVIEAARRTYEDALEQILRNGQGLGVFRVVDARITTMAIIAMLTGLNTWFREDGRLSFDEVEALYWDMVQKTVGISA